MLIETITAPFKASYLNDFMEFLPANRLISKGITGCGGTTLELSCNRDSIIAMPFKNLIKNKEAQTAGILGVYEGVSQDDIKAYARSHKGYLKICTTYDSLPRVIKALDDCAINAYKRFFLLVDEWHILRNAYVFRNSAVRGLLDVSSSFERVSFLSATPIEDEFNLEQLRKYPIVNIAWQNVKDVQIMPIKTNKIKNEVVSIIKDFIEGKRLGNAHIFLNSVTTIATILQCDKLKDVLTPNLVKIVCSENDANRVKIAKKEGYSISDDVMNPKKINFYTCLAWEGCDMYDEDGKTFIVSDGSIAHTLADVATLCVQIIGRLRNSKYSDAITHIYSTTKYDKYDGVSYNEYKELTYRQLEESKQYVDQLNSNDSSFIEKTISMLSIDAINNDYKMIVDGRLVIDENLLKIDLQNFKITNGVYKCQVNLSKEYEKAGYRIESALTTIYTDKLAENNDARIPFSVLFEEYVKLIDESKGYVIGNHTDRIKLIESTTPLVRIAYKELGVDKVRELKYVVTNIKRALIKTTNTNTDMKILRMINQKLSKGVYIENKIIKEVITDIYREFGIVKAAKATDLLNWYEVKNGVAKVEGKSAKSMMIIRDKIMFK
jgi:hypothetical protein